jgi:8-oxo-dGTP diphosphatase
MREFGERDPAATYILRPGAYAIMQDEQGRIGIVVTPTGGFLPGGGMEEDESPEQALIREVQEECGLHVLVIERLGNAVQLVHSAREAKHFRKECIFFRVVALGSTGTAIEPEHELIWLDRAQALEELTHASYRWAVEEWTGGEESG